MRVLTTSIVDVSLDTFFRSDFKYHEFITKNSWYIFGASPQDSIPLKDILDDDYRLADFTSELEYRGIPTGQSYIDNDGDIIDYQLVTKDNCPGRLKYSIDEKNILISSLRLAKSPAFSFCDTTSNCKYIFSNGFYIFKVKNGWQRKFVLYLLRSKKIKSIIDNNIYRGIGISAYRSDDLLKIRIKNLSVSEQTKALTAVEPIEDKIYRLKSTIKPVKSTIDDVFTREFGFDNATFEELKTHKKFNISVSDCSNNPDLRFSAKFHRDAGEFVMSQLCAITDKKIKHYLAEPIILGASISPSDYSEDGECYYISMATIKNWEFSAESAQTVSTLYSDQKQAKTIQKGDILLARSGEGTIGKVAIIEDEDLQGIFADFTMRIRLKNYNSKFAYYYFRTTYFQYLVEIYKKGLGNNTNIFPIVIQEFPLPNISLDEQQRIVDEIQTEITSQNKIKNEIDRLRSQIDKIIEDAITSRS